MQGLAHTKLMLHAALDPKRCEPATTDRVVMPFKLRYHGDPAASRDARPAAQHARQCNHVELLLWGKLLEDISMEALARQPRKLLNDPSNECVLLLVSRWPCSSCRKRCHDPDPCTPAALSHPRPPPSPLATQPHRPPRNPADPRPSTLATPPRRAATQRNAARPG